MSTSMLVSIVFVLLVVIFCFAKPNAARIFLGFFFLTMALGVNGSFTFGNPQAYLDYANGALIPFYRTVTVSVISVSPFGFGLLVMAFEITMALLLLHKGRAVKLGLLGTMLFLARMTPLDWLQLPWLGLIIGELYLLRLDFERSFLDILLSKFTQKASNV